jgi:hypothetical protein
MTRQEANRIILRILIEYVEDNPDIRFHQMLHNLNITKQVVTPDGKFYLEDLYNMEPVKVLELMSNDPEQPTTPTRPEGRGITFRDIVCYDERYEEDHDEIRYLIEEENVLTYDDWVKHYDMDGRIMIMKSPDWGMEGWDGRNDYHFACGPSIGDECVSDSIYIDWYIEDVIKRQGLPNMIETQLAENYHGVNVGNDADANKIYDLLIKGFKEDGFEVVEVHP